MKTLLIYLFLQFLPLCLFGQNATVIYPNSNSEVKTIAINDHIAAIFPASYQPDFNRDYLKNRFTPDSLLIELVEMKLIEQYTDAYKRYLKAEWESFKQNKEAFEWDKLKSERSSRVSSLLNVASKKQKVLYKYDRQYLAFINEKGERIILIHLIDFSNDEYNLKKTLDKAWITGFGEWFEYNTESFEYVIDRDKLYFFGWTER
jgi:hypothetical protein